MGSRRHPPLTVSEVEAILRSLGFTCTRHLGSSHAQWELAASGPRKRSLVTVDTAVREFWEEIIKSMIRQSGFTREQFYGATKGTAKKIGLR